MRKALLLILALCLLVTVMLAGCTPKEEVVEKEPVAEKEEEEKEEPKEEPKEEEEEEEEVVEEIKYSQAPMLDDMDLPPVEERLPLEPKLTNEMPPEMLTYVNGKYGGKIRTATARVNWDPDVFVALNEPLLNTPGILGEEITGNVLKDYKVNGDNTEFTFFLREGLKWSDGVPVTMEDFRFTIEDVIFNEELYAVFPVWLRSAGEADGTPMKFEVIDEWSFKLTFDQPYGGLLIRMAIQGWRGYSELLKPAHFLKNYHKDYADMSDIEAKAVELQVELDDFMWVNVFNQMNVNNWDVCQPKAEGFPSLYPWIKVDTGKDDFYRWERNPYYFKVDSAGQQLPYVDSIETTLVQDLEMLTLKIISGEVDFTRESASLVDMPLYKENEDKGFTALLAWMHVNPTDFHLNMTYDDPVWQEVSRDVRFRKALSLAMDRDEIIDAIYYGHATSGIIMDDTYDVDAANELLDDMGMVIGKDGYRTAPNGEPFEFLIEIGNHAPDMEPTTEMVVAMWRELDLNVKMKSIDPTLWGQKNAANELQATCMWSVIPLWYWGDFGQGMWGHEWNRWKSTGGAEGEEPPQDVKDFYAQVNRMTVESPTKAYDTFDNIAQSIRENYWYFAYIDNVKQPLIVNSKLRNVSDKGFAIASNFAMEEYWYED